MTRFALRLTTALALMLPGAWALAASTYQLDPARSSVHFISVKNGTVAEVHHFGRLSGSVDADGNARVVIALDSVETGVDLRNKRMRKFLFDTDKMPTAVITAELTSELVKRLAPGGIVSTSVPLTLRLHGREKTYTAALRLVMLSDGDLQVSTQQPILVNVADFALSEGVARLVELANLKSIMPVVPVTATLVFEQDGD